MLYCLHHHSFLTQPVSSYQSHTPTLSVQINKSKASSRAPTESKENGRSDVCESVNKDGAF